MPVSYPIGAFKPFSLADTIRAGQAGQARRLNELKIQSAESQMAREAKLRGLAQMATKPTYGDYEQPPEQMFPGEAPIPGLQQQTGAEYSPERHADLLAQEGETDKAAKIREQISKMTQEERDTADYNATEIAQALAGVDKETGAGWDEGFQRLAQKGIITEDQYTPFSPQAYEQVMNDAREIEDILADPTQKPQLTELTKLQRTRDELRSLPQTPDVVRQVKEINDRIEKINAPSKGQVFNLSRTPSEKAAARNYEEVLDQADNAESQLFGIQKAKALVPDISEGKLEPAKTWLRGWGEALGVPVDVEKLSDAVSFRATMKQAVLDGMKNIKGTASEADRATVEQSVAALENPEEANKFLLDTAESMARRTIEKADFYSKWATDNSGSLLGARRAWSKHINKVPLIRKKGKQIYHYYQFRDQMLKANMEKFSMANDKEIEDAIINAWRRDM